MSAEPDFDTNVVPPRTRNALRQYLERCSTTNGEFRLATNSEPSPYALCFAIFGLHLLKDCDALKAGAETWDCLLRGGLEQMRRERASDGALHRDKAYLQLLTFTLSALYILGTLRSDPLEGHVIRVLPDDIKAELEETGALRGVARSGNHAMFVAILLLHARDYLNGDVQRRLDDWVALHVASMNEFGFWGTGRSMSHLQFQNGYHQYEMFEYLGLDNVPWGRAADCVALLADEAGQFAPYPGGGGCYDYDAVFMLTGGGEEEVARRHDLLLRTAQTILSEQNSDGGFAESRYVRPRSVPNLLRMFRHIASAPGLVRLERLKQGLAVLRPKHDRIHTHWTRYSREWGESDLWDSWFRMLTLARIEAALDPCAATRWGFINYPGIGFHPSARRTKTAR